VICDRLEKFRQAEIERQKIKVKRNWRRRRRRQVKKAVVTSKQSYEERGPAYDDLMRSPEGCRAVVEILEIATDRVQERGYLMDVELKNVVYLHGFWPVDDDILRDITTGYTLHTLNLACTPGITAKELDAWIEPANRPKELRGLTREQLIPGDAARCRERLLEYLELRKHELAIRGAELARYEDDPELRRLLEMAETLDDKAARKADRCHAEARITFDRALKALFQTLERDAEEADELPPDDDFPDCDECDDEDDEAQTLSRWERVPEGRVRAESQRVPQQPLSP
jgi:hypothetical protein